LDGILRGDPSDALQRAIAFGEGPLCGCRDRAPAQTTGKPFEANLQWPIWDASGHQLTSESIGRAMSRPRFETPPADLALGEPDAAAVGRPRFFQRAHPHNNRGSSHAASWRERHPVSRQREVAMKSARSSLR